MKLIVVSVLCIAAVVGQISAASAQPYYGAPGDYYYYGTGALMRAEQTPISLGWLYTRSQPAGYGRPYPALRMADGTLACSNSNYRPVRGWCQRIW